MLIVKLYKQVEIRIILSEKKRRRDSYWFVDLDFLLFNDELREKQY